MFANKDKIVSLNLSSNISVKRNMKKKKILFWEKHRLKYNTYMRAKFYTLACCNKVKS